MLFRRVIDVTSADYRNSEQTMAASTHCRQEGNGQVCCEDDHIEDSIPSNLLIAHNVEDSPEVFKRTRFVTRWQDSEQSRDFNFVKVGAMTCWAPAGPALPVRRRICDILREHVERRERYIFQPPKARQPISPRSITCGMFFIGPELQKSKPFILIYSESKSIRRRALKVARELPCLGPQSDIAVATCSGPIFRADIESWKRGVARTREREMEARL
jgi:hypothetical protein